MLEISAIDSTPTSVPVQVRSGPSFAAKTSGPGLPGNTTQSFANYLKPIETPLVFSGFTEDAVQRFAPQFASAGIVPVMGVGSASDVAQPEPMEPGSAVNAGVGPGGQNNFPPGSPPYIRAENPLSLRHPFCEV